MPNLRASGRARMVSSKFSDSAACAHACTERQKRGNERKCKERVRAVVSVLCLGHLTVAVAVEHVHHRHHVIHVHRPAKRPKASAMSGGQRAISGLYCNRHTPAWVRQKQRYSSEPPSLSPTRSPSRASPAGITPNPRPDHTAQLELLHAFIDTHAEEGATKEQ